MYEKNSQHSIFYTAPYNPVRFMVPKIGNCTKMVTHLNIFMDMKKSLQVCSLVSPSIIKN